MSTQLAGFVAIELPSLHPSPNNIRDRLEGIEELAVSIRENGLIQPLVVQRIPGRDGYQVVAGHRRLAAVRRLDWAKAPCIVRRDMLPDEELLAMLVENGQRAGLDPIEEARALNKLKAGGMSDSEIARKIGRSQPLVSGRLSLLALPVEAQEELRAGFGTLGGAIARAREESGRVRPGAKGKKAAAHLATHHPLATRAANRCRAKKHKRGGSASVGGVACGECWESVIRADERQQLHTQSEARGRCVLCDVQHDPEAHIEKDAS